MTIAGSRYRKPQSRRSRTLYPNLLRAKGSDSVVEMATLVEMSSECSNIGARHCLITGVSGFIGQHLVRELAVQKIQTRGADLKVHQSDADEVLFADVCQRPIDVGVFSGVWTVFHLAGKVHALSEVIQDDREYFRINTEGTRNVLEAARKAGVRRFVFFSTVKAMSRDDGRKANQSSKIRDHTSTHGEREGERPASRDCDRPLTEEDFVEPDTPYGKSKLEAEKLVLHGGYVPEPVVLRLCMVYGPGGKGNMQKMIDAVHRNRFPPLPEVGNRRSMVYVDDVVEAAILVAERPEAIGQAFIVSDGQTYSTRQIYEMICQALGKKVPSWTIPLWALKGLGLAGDVIGKLRGRRFIFDSDALDKLTGDAWFSSDKIQQMLGFRPQWDLKKALPAMVEEYTQRKEKGIG